MSIDYMPCIVNFLQTDVDGSDSDMIVQPENSSDSRQSDAEGSDVGTDGAGGGEEWEDVDSVASDEEFDMNLRLSDDPEVNSFSLEFLREYATGGLKKTQGARFWELHRRHKTYDPKKLQSFPTLLRKVKRVLPVITQYWRVKDFQTGRVYEGSGLHYPAAKYKDLNRYELLETWTRIKLRDMMKFHVRMHSSKRQDYLQDGILKPNWMPLVFTSDGIPCGKSSSESLHVLAIRFLDCKGIYILQTRIAKRGVAKRLEDFLDPFIDECLALSAQVKKFLGDAPIRSFFKCLKGHAGYYSCEVCEAPGLCVQKRVCYPACMIGHPLRSLEKWQEAVSELEEGEETSVNGVIGRSPLLKLPHFDMVSDAPADPMHRD